MNVVEVNITMRAHVDERVRPPLEVTEEGFVVALVPLQKDGLVLWMDSHGLAGAIQVPLD